MNLWSNENYSSTNLFVDPCIVGRLIMAASLCIDDLCRKERMLPLAPNSPLDLPPPLLHNHGDHHLDRPYATHSSPLMDNNLRWFLPSSNTNSLSLPTSLTMFTATCISSHTCTKSTSLSLAFATS
jgi:hypothetical protein